MKRNNEEETTQLCLLTWSKCFYFYYNNERICLFDYLFHIPNGGSRNIIEAVKLKKLGVKAGVSDIFIPVPVLSCTNGSENINDLNDVIYCGLWIELKSKKGKLTKMQNEFFNKMNKMRYITKVCYSFEEAKNVIQNYLELV